MTQTARDRAEDLLHRLQERARDLVSAEEGLLGALRELAEDRGFAPADARKRVEETLGRFKSNALWERVRSSDPLVALSDYRDEIEHRVEDTARRLLDTLNIVTTPELEKIAGEIDTLRKKVETLEQQLGTSRAQTN